jgi:hypothetical protein
VELYSSLSATEAKAEASESPSKVRDGGAGTGLLASADAEASESASDVWGGGVETGSVTGGGAAATVFILTTVDAVAIASRRALRINTVPATITMATTAHKTIRVAEFNFIRSPTNGQRIVARLSFSVEVTSVLAAPKNKKAGTQTSVPALVLAGCPDKLVCINWG